MKIFYKSFFVMLFCLLLTNFTKAQRKMENLSRGVIVTRTSNTDAFINWRLLGTESFDLAFNIYRVTGSGSPVKLNSAPLTQGTNYVDATANLTLANSYFVKAIVNNVEQNASPAYTLPANTPVQPFYKVPIHNTPGYYVLHAFIGDVDGDGEYDFVVHKDPISDPNETMSQLVEAYKNDGTFLWQMDLGPNSKNRDNILPGSAAINIGHADNIMVYDINQDGKAEVILRTANGVKFADGTTVVNANNNIQYMSVISGLTGVEISRTLYNNPHLNRGPMSSHIGIAYLDGINPSVVWEAKNRNADNSFNEITTAWDWNGTTLVQKWQYTSPIGEAQMTGHQIRCVDVDGDGKDEVIPQGFVIDDDGTLLYSLSDNDIFHGDRFFISDLDPSRPGMEMYGIQQGYSKTGIMWYYVDAKTGDVLNSQSDPANRDLGRGMVGDFDPRYKGTEFFTFVDGLYNVSGARTSNSLPNTVYPNLRVYWDGDLGSEILDGSRLVKWNYITEKDERLLTLAGLLAPRSVPATYGDIIGDWREEMVFASSDNNSLTVYTTPFPSTHRIYTLPHNPQYRNDMTTKGYNQSYTTSYYIGFDMQEPPTPSIQNADKYWDGTNGSNWDLSASNWQTSNKSLSAFANNDVVMFDQRGKNANPINITTDVAPSKIWVMNPAGKDYTLSGTGKLTGNMTLVKAMDGNFTLKGNHSYTGNTIIEEGTLIIDGNLQSPVTIKGKGNLAGKGKLNGTITLNSALNTSTGGIRPGLGNLENQLGTITVNGNLSIAGTNNFEFDIVPGSVAVNDSLFVNGNLVLNGTNNIQIKFKDNTPVAGTYTLIKCTGSLTAVKEKLMVKGVTGVSFDLLIENNEIKLIINSSRAAANVAWKGTVNGNWDFETQNFDQSGTQTAFVSNDVVSFKDDATVKHITLDKTVYANGLNFENGNYTLMGNGNISGNTDITKANGNHTLSILMDKNTYTGKTIVNGGELTLAKIAGSGKPSSIGSANSDPANIVINSAVLNLGGQNATNRGITLIGNNTINISDSKDYTIFTGDVLGSGIITKTGQGSLFILGKKSFTGTAIIKEGALNLRGKEGNQNGIGPGPVTIENATLNLDDVRDYAQIAWDIIVPEGKTATLKTDGRSTMLGKLTGGGTLNVYTPYVRTDFKGDWSAFTGNVVISGSDFRIANTKGYPNATINLTEGTMYTMSGSNNASSLGALSGVAGTSISTAAWTIGSKNTNATFAGTIAGNTITKVGTGTWTLTGNNTLTGAVTINGGRILVNNPTNTKGLGSGTVTVNSGGIIGGTGNVRGPLIVNGGGTLQAGNDGIGLFTDSTSIKLNSGAITEMEINKNSFSYDKVIVIGTITFGGKLIVKNLSSQAFSAGDKFTLFNATNYNGDFSAIDPETPGNGLLWSFSKTTGVLNVIADPNAVFTLPANNFSVSAIDETCNSSNNGKIKVTATEAHNYKAILNGNSANPYSFSTTSPLEIKDLIAGTYALCITVPEQPSYQQCFDLVISEPQPLSVFSTVNKTDKVLNLNLSGGKVYQVTLNGESFKTTESAVSLTLADGENEVVVLTDKECQGVFNKRVFVSDQPLVYPNPFVSVLYVDVDEAENTLVEINVFSLAGNRVFNQRCQIESGQISFDLSELPSGAYMLNMLTSKTNTSQKIIKK